jgi:hypothetical protein
MSQKRSRANSSDKPTDTASKRTGANFSNRSTNTVSSWLDLYPPKDKPEPTSKLPPDPKLVSRIKALTSSLEDIKVSVNIREYYLNLYSTHGSYCASCSPMNKEPGSCGSTCTLFRPSHKPGATTTITEAWVERAREANETYYRMVGDMDAVDYGVDAHTIEEWEEVIEKLRKESRNESEREEEKGWPARGNMDVARGLRLDWSFDGRWGKGSGQDVEIGPEKVG